MPASTSPIPLRKALPDLSWWTAVFRDAEIPVLAATAESLELMRANEDAFDANSIGEMVATDPLMTLKVLAYAASHRSSRLLTDAETVTAALVLMGITPFFTAFGPQATVEDRLAGQPEALQGLQRVLKRAERAARFALGFAAHRMDPDAAVIHSAAMLHDFAEMLLWCHAPELALQIRARQQADRHLRSAAVQREILNIELADLEQSLMKAWRLPELLTHITDDKRLHDPQVQCVRLAVRLARHTADGWDDAAIPDDISDIATLLNMRQEPTLKLLHELY
ncbi:HDOD domain-containing protein [Paucibacter sp. O1-1]|uniref:HDOD domain-containing protein n=1 Tax=Paucibacter sp. M5-1 TaxID=3015998 RepID=UPI0010F56F9D|nr:HDOD domain-containing protein [Paucibacter sp. M5-1]MCU7372443.1 HDOD domain-containing protein [Paucibacter sp. O1-1]MCZ7884419.1 HDOD domain-containing protein [Paucibacter sp. M5-1]MDA3827436.1 HDOD domain-containing protein [Paucibacter sp. O1-1]